jgi:membrane protease YdiL (CAAX protease family)
MVQLKIIMNIRKRIIVLCISIIILLTRFWVSPEIREAISSFFDYPKYEGIWAAFEHIFLYTTFTAILCFLFWYILYKKQFFPSVKSYFIFNKKSFLYGIISGLSIFIFNIIIAFFLIKFTDLEGLIGYNTQFLRDYWTIIGNIFSNFYEEFIYSGFLLISFRYIFKKNWIAIILTGLIFGFIHTQYPIPFRIVLSISGFITSWVVIKTNSIWAAWLNHMLVDVLMGLFIIQP